MENLNRCVLVALNKEDLEELIPVLAQGINTTTLPKEKTSKIYSELVSSSKSMFPEIEFKKG